MAGSKSYNSQANPGMMVPTTNVWDPSQIESLEDKLTPEFKEVLVRLYQNLNIMALAVNARDTGIYSNQEFLNGQTFFPNPNNTSNSSTAPSQRQVFRTTINTGTLPNTATITIPHYIDINSGYTFTRIYGAATSTTTPEYIPLPYASTVSVADNIELWIDGVNVNIRTAADYSAYNVSYVIAEYIKS